MDLASGALALPEIWFYHQPSEHEPPVRYGGALDLASVVEWVNGIVNGHERGVASGMRVFVRLPAPVRSL